MKKKINNLINLLLILIALIIFPLNLQGYIKVSAFIDFVLFIDPGHGGNDNGADYNDVYEDEINLAISGKLYEICLKKNLLSYISRSDDYDLASQYASNRKREDLKRRTENINHSGSDAFVSIHVNKYLSESVHGPMVYYEKNDEQSYLLAKYVQSELNNLTGQNKRVHNDDFYIFNNCDIPGILVECGFISNEDERVKLLDENYQLSIAQGIYQGVYHYYLNK